MVLLKVAETAVICGVASDIIKELSWCTAQDSEDIRYMVGALEALGIEVEADWGAGRARVRGCSGRFPVDGAELFLGNAGTAMRFAEVLSQFRPQQQQQQTSFSTFALMLTHERLMLTVRHIKKQLIGSHSETVHFGSSQFRVAISNVRMPPCPAKAAAEKGLCGPEHTVHGRSAGPTAADTFHGVRVRAQAVVCSSCCGREGRVHARRGAAHAGASHPGPGRRPAAAGRRRGLLPRHRLPARRHQRPRSAHRHGAASVPSVLIVIR